MFLFLIHSLGTHCELKTCRTNRHTTPNMCHCDRFTGYYFSDTLFSLSNRILSDSKIGVLEKGLYFAPIKKKSMNLS